MKNLIVLLLLFATTHVQAQDGDHYYREAWEFFYQKKQYTNALVSINKAEKKEEADHIFALKASILSSLRHCREAEEYAKRAIKMDDKESRNVRAYGNVLIDCRRPKEAIPFFDKALELAEKDRDSLYILMDRAAAKSQSMDFQGAYDDAKTALVIDSTHIGILSNLAVVCDEVGRGDETLLYLLKAIEVDSMFLPAYINIGFKYQVEGEYEKSNEYFAKAIEIDPSDAAFAYSNRAYNKLQLDDLKGAMDDINQSIKMLYNNSYAYRNRALIWLAKGEKAKACEDLEKAIRFGFTTRYGDEVEQLQKEHCE